MKKITLLEDEKIIHKVRYSKKVLIFDFALLMIFSSLHSLYQNKQGFDAFIAMFIMLFLFIPMFIRLVLNFIRVVFYRVYITNLRVIFVKGYIFKIFNIYQLSEIKSIYIKSKWLDRRLGVTNVMFRTVNKKVVLRSITWGNYVLELLSKYLVDNQK